MYLNQVGGQDELVFDGNSFFMDSKGNLLEKCFAWKEDYKVIKFPEYLSNKNDKNNNLDYLHEFNTWSALTLGLRDYFLKNSFHKIVLGLSGGIDSAVSAANCCRCCGSKKCNRYFDAI